MRILQKESIGLIIDFQERLVPHMYGRELLLQRTELLIKGLQTLRVPLIVTEQYTKGLGPTVASIKDLINPFESSEKISFSCIDDSVISSRIYSFACKFVIIAGIEAHVCVLQTVTDLLESGKIPVVVEDCLSSRNEHDKAVALQRMIQSGAILTTSESVLFELTRFAGTETFKSVSKLVK